MIDGIEPSTKRKRMTRARWRWSLAYASCSVLLLLLSGCHRPDTLTTNDGFISPLKPADITYQELATRYNAAIKPVTALRSRADIEIEWIEIDEDGDRNYRSESGDGKFIMRRGERHLDTMMTVEKLGKIYLWAGSNKTHYYLFDRVDGDNETLYVGEHAHIGPRMRFPLPIQPGMVPILLGLEPLPVQGLFLEEQTTIDLYGEQYLLSMPELGMRMLIDPVTFRPTRVDLTDAKGYSVITAKLNGKLSVQDAALVDGRPPLICKKAEVYVAGFESRFTLDFDSATASTRNIKDAMFDLDALTRALKPDRVIDLGLTWICLDRVLER